MLHQFVTRASIPWCLSPAIFGGCCFVIDTELLSNKNLDTEQTALIRQLLNIFVRFVYKQEITDLTLALRKNYELKLPDAIIAAAAHNSCSPLLRADTQLGK